MASSRHGITEPTDMASDARGALERVCSGARLDPASRYYSSRFVDHVNDVEFHGLEGAERSIEMYERALSNMKIVVEEQVIDGDRVASRFVVTGKNHGRPVRFNGITISRFENGSIVEDWSVTDTLGMLRQLGFWRSLLMAVRQWRSLRAAAPNTAGAPRSARGVEE